MAKDRLSSLFVAGIIGREAFGILSWAQKGPRIPLSFMDAIMKVTFPTFARLQDHKDILKKSLERSLYFIALFVFPMVAGITLISPDIINIIPKYTKWAPAIFPLYFYAANVAIAAITTPITNAFNAIGKITLTTKFMIMWTVLTWILFPWLSIKFGYLGTAYATLLVGSSSFIVWYFAQKIFGVRVLSAISKPLLATILMLIFSLIFQNFGFYGWVSLIGKVVISVSVYLLFHLLFSKNEIRWFYQQLLCLRQKNQ